MSRRCVGLRTVAVVPLLLAWILAPFTVTPAGAAASSSSIVVNEFAANRYVELRNVSDSAVDIGGFPLRLCGTSGVVGTPRVALGTELQPGAFYVIASSSFTGGPVDQTYNGVFPGGAVLLDLHEAWVDGVAVVTGSPCGEGDPAPQCPQMSSARDAASTDTDSNAADFSCRFGSPGEEN